MARSITTKRTTGAEMATDSRTPASWRSSHLKTLTPGKRPDLREFAAYRKPGMEFHSDLDVKPVVDPLLARGPDSLVDGLSAAVVRRGLPGEPPRSAP